MDELALPAAAAPGPEKLPLAPAERETAADEDPVPPLGRRFLGLLLAPCDTFEALDERWGWAGPWLAIAGVGVLAGAVHQARADLGSVMAAAQQHALELMSDSKRRAFDQLPQETRDLTAKVQVFFARIGDFFEPTVWSILSIVVVGALLFGVAYVLGGKRDFLRSVVVAAHAKLVAIVGYAAFAFAALLGNPMPRTSLSNATDNIAHPVLGAFLDGFDPIRIWHTALIAIGLAYALNVRPRRAVGFAVGLHVLGWLATIGLAAAMGGR